MYDFNYHRPSSLDEAVTLLGQGEDVKVLAGGHTLLPTMKQRLAAPSDVVDLSRIAALKGIEATANAVRIGAATSHADVAASGEVRGRIPALAALAARIGDPHVRNRGTLGGSIANNDPNADYPAACLALGATIVTTKREIAADDFFVDMFETALDEDEIITRVDFPVPRRAGYAKFPNPASRYALVGVFVAEGGDDIRVAVTGAGPCVFRVPEMEAALGGDFSAAALEDIKVDADGLNADIHASADYRAHLVGVMARRAVEAALEAR
jgi:aerobic carbon-monoxide dehydrogenase medium subunit